MGIDNSKSIDSLLLSVQMKLFDKCIVLCRSYSIFFKNSSHKNQRFNNFKQITFQGYLCDAFNVHRIGYDYRFIEIIGVNFFNDKFSIKSTYNQCCGSETFISDPASDPDPAFSEFMIRIRFRIRIFGSGYSNPDPDPGFESGSETGQNFFFLN